MIHGISSINNSAWLGIQAKNNFKSSEFSDILKDNYKTGRTDSVTFQNNKTTTQSVKQSKGIESLTPVQKQYLKDKYSTSSLSSEGFDSLLSDLNTMGVLSDSDLRMADMRVDYVGTNQIMIYDVPYDKVASFSLSKNYADYFQRSIWNEKAQWKAAAELTGCDPIYDKELLNTHERIANALSELF